MVLVISTHHTLHDSVLQPSIQYLNLPNVLLCEIETNPHPHYLSLWLPTCHTATSLTCQMSHQMQSHRSLETITRFFNDGAPVSGQAEEGIRAPKVPAQPLRNLPTATCHCRHRASVRHWSPRAGRGRWRRREMCRR